MIFRDAANFVVCRDKHGIPPPGVFVICHPVPYFKILCPMPFPIKSVVIGLPGVFILLSGFSCDRVNNRCTKRFDVDICIIS